MKFDLQRRRRRRKKKGKRDIPLSLCVGGGGGGSSDGNFWFSLGAIILINFVIDAHSWLLKKRRWENEYNWKENIEQMLLLLLILI